MTRYSLTLENVIVAEGDVVVLGDQEWVVVAQVGAAWDGVRRVYEVEAAVDAEGDRIPVRFGWTLSGPLP